jgi:hypothetical protein
VRREEQGHVVGLAVAVQALKFALDEFGADLGRRGVTRAVANRNVAGALAVVGDALFQVSVVPVSVEGDRAGEACRVALRRCVTELLAGKAQRGVNANAVDSLARQLYVYQQLRFRVVLFRV